MRENLYGISFGGPFRWHWQVGGIAYGPGEKFEVGPTADEEQRKVWDRFVESELRRMDVECEHRAVLRRLESRIMFRQ